MHNYEVKIAARNLSGNRPDLRPRAHSFALNVKDSFREESCKMGHLT